MLFENTMQRAAYFQFHSSDPDELQILNRARLIKASSQGQQIGKLDLNQ